MAISPKPGSLHPAVCAVGTVLLLLCGGLGLPGAQPTNEVDQLKQELRQLEQRFNEAQAQHRQEMEALLKRLEALTKQLATEGEKKRTGEEPQVQVAAPVATNAPTVATEGPRWTPASPLRLQSGGAWLDLGLVATFAAGSSTADDIAGGMELGGHDPNQRGFTVQGVELNLAGAVDPYFRGNVNLLFQVDADGESLFELEEAWLETLSLPGNLQVRAGQILTDFGRQNPTHVHAWAFVDTPVVLGRFMGPDGLRNPGARISWLTPTAFYSELSFSVQDSHGATAAGFRSDGDAHGDSDEDELPFAYRHAENDRGVEGFLDLLLTPRYALSIDLTSSQVLLVGASASFGPNSSGASGDTTTQIYGVDLAWKWKSPRHHGGFPFVAFQAEGLLRRYEAGAFGWDENENGLADPGEIVDTRTGLPAMLSDEVLVDYGLYSQLLYGFRRGWVAGLRVDYAGGDEAEYERGYLALDGESLGRDPQRAPRWRLSPNLTWYPSEFSKIRLQYNFDERRDIGGDQRDHSIWLQFEFLLGAHAAHKF